MAFVFYQVCQVEKCNETYPFKFPQTISASSSVCLLSDRKKEGIGFVCNNSKKKNLVNFEGMINEIVIKYVREKEKEMSYLKGTISKLNAEKKKTYQRL